MLMKKIALAFSFVTLALASFAQEQTPQETARSFMRSGDFDNAVLVLTRALQTDKNNLEMQKDLALSLYYKRDYAKALDVVKNLLDNDAADAQSYQIGGNVYKALEEVKDAEKMYKKALKKFPNSGALHSEYGELLWAKKDADALVEWEKGIRVDPSYAGNFYNAALFYYYTKDKTWSLIYGEVFINMESLTDRAANMKQLLLSGYKEKLFADADMVKDQEKLTNFSRAYLETMGRQAGLLANGVSIDVLTMVRTRFILDWFKNQDMKFPFKLFDYQQQLIREGMFEAYNQWLFTTTDNLAAYENWTRTHPEAFAKFNAFQKSRVFKLPPGQYYAGR
ncbi:MAG: tetratricopeptide domain protein [Flaviaesturariibacter sp.]|nr:tetratricopeptide domain protein [Flaviaesturariibacter sp.]